VNIGAAGTFVVRKPGSRARFLAALRSKLPFETLVVVCDGRDFMRLETEHPYGPKPPPAGVVRFVSIMPNAARLEIPLPVRLPTTGQWLVRVIGADRQYVFGEYRRHMKTIGYLGQIDRMSRVQATTRNWNTIEAVLRILKDQ
jgi:uncharacterized protein (DUF1697 family)